MYWYEFSKENLYIFLLIAILALLSINFYMYRYKKLSTYLLYLRTKYVRKYIQLILIFLSLVFLYIASLRPLVFTGKVKTEEGIDLVILVDVSKSMTVQDVSPSRLELSKLFLEKFVRNSTYIKSFSLVAFAAGYRILSPPTTDKDYIITLIKSLSPYTVTYWGTKFSEVAKAVSKVFKSSYRKRITLLVSDGEFFDQKEDISRAIDLLKKSGVMVVSIGVGTLSGGYVLEDDIEKEDFFGEKVISKLCPENLINIAKSTGGFYMNITEIGDIWSLEKRIKTLSPAVVPIITTENVKEYYFIPLSISVVLLFITLIL